LELGVKRATLAREVTWLPAVENRGEGVFLSFKKDAVETWLARPEVKERGKQLLAGFNCWKEDHKDSTREFFGLPYIMLHSLSHLLITAVSLECGQTRDTASCCTRGLPMLRELWADWWMSAAKSIFIWSARLSWAGCAPMTRSVRSTTPRIHTSAAFCTAQHATVAF